MGLSLRVVRSTALPSPSWSGGAHGRSWLHRLDEARARSPNG